MQHDNALIGWFVDILSLELNGVYFSVDLFCNNFHLELIPFLGFLTAIDFLKGITGREGGVRDFGSFYHLFLVIILELNLIPVENDLIFTFSFFDLVFVDRGHRELGVVIVLFQNFYS